MKTIASLLCFLLTSLFAVTCVQAEVPVVDVGQGDVAVMQAVVGAEKNGTAVETSTAAQDPMGVLYEKIQILEQEMQALRGQIEQQQNTISKLKQQQKQNYLDVDKRLSELRTDMKASAANMPVPPAADTPVLPSVPAAAINTVAEKDSYDRAYALLNQNKKAEAELAFRKHLINYAEGDYAGNAYYWLGQIFLSQTKYEEAALQFSTLLEKMPEHRKAMDARFSLGKVYFQQGKSVEAAKLIEEVAKQPTATGKLAQDFLKTNFK